MDGWYAAYKLLKFKQVLRHTLICACWYCDDGKFSIYIAQPQVRINQQPFSCDETRRQVLRAALKSPAGRRISQQEATTNFAAAPEVRLCCSSSSGSSGRNIYIYPNWTAFSHLKNNNRHRGLYLVDNIGLRVDEHTWGIAASHPLPMSPTRTNRKPREVATELALTNLIGPVKHNAVGRFVLPSLPPLFKMPSTGSLPDGYVE